MANVQEIIKDVTFSSEFDPRTLVLNEELEFLQVNPASLAIDGLRLVGFANPLPAYGSTESVIWPVTDFARLPADQRTISRQGKGVGPRLHNTLEAVGGASDIFRSASLFTFDINPDFLLDLHANQGSRGVRIARHAVRIARASMGTVEGVVAGIHEGYKDAHAVRMSIPPHSELRQLEHGIRNVPGITPQFILIRNANITLHPIGSAESKKRN